MSLFDLFRGLFGVPGGRRPRDERRDPFFDVILDEDDEEGETGFQHEDLNRSLDPFDDAFRFGFSFGPGGMRFEEPQVFGQIFKEMEEIFAGLGRFDGHSLGQRSVPSIEAPPLSEDAGKGGARGGSGNSLRDFMLKSPERLPHKPPLPPPSAAPQDRDSEPQGPAGLFPRWSPSKFSDFWKGGPLRPKEEEKREDGDLDSQVSSGGLDHILTPEPSQPKMRSFFKSVSVSTVVRPDGTVEERRTVRDSEGNEETSVSVSGGPAVEDQSGPVMPGGSRPSSDMQDHFSVFSKFFGGFRG